MRISGSVPRRCLSTVCVLLRKMICICLAMCAEKACLRFAAEADTLCSITRIKVQKNCGESIYHKHSSKMRPNCSLTMVVQPNFCVPRWKMNWTCPKNISTMFIQYTESAGRLIFREHLIRSPHILKRTASLSSAGTIP